MLISYISQLVEEATTLGEIDALPIVGLTSNGIKLLSNYVDDTGDIQTAACLACYIPRDEVNTSPYTSLVGEWIEAYRERLNSWSLWHVRCKFDVYRFRTKKDGEGRELLTASPEEDPAPPTITLDCTYCNKSMSLVRKLFVVQNTFLT